MSSKEHFFGVDSSPSEGTHRAVEPKHPSRLPPELRSFLRNRDFACVTESTDHGTIFVVKAPGPDIESARGSVPIGLRHELYDFPTAPVIRMVTTIFDQPARPLAFETFVNVGDQRQRAEYAALAEQDELLLLFYDAALEHRLTKGVPLLDGGRIAEVVRQADGLYASIPDAQYNFDVAKQWVIAKTTL